MEHPRSSEDVDTLPTATQASLDPPRSEGRSTNQLRRRSPDWLQNVKLPESNSILRSAVLAKQRFNTSSIAPHSPLAIVVRVSIFWPDYCLNPRQAAPGRTALGKASTVLVASACSLSKLRELGHQRARECCIGGPDASGFRARGAGFRCNGLQDGNPYPSQRKAAQAQCETCCLSLPGILRCPAVALVDFVQHEDWPSNLPTGCQDGTFEPRCLEGRKGPNGCKDVLAVWHLNFKMTGLRPTSLPPARSLGKPKPRRTNSARGLDFSMSRAAKDSS